MEVIASQDVFNLQAFLMGCLVLIVCVVVQALFVLVTIVICKSRIHRYVRGHRYVLAYLIFLFGIILLVTSHLSQIYTWGLALHHYGVIDNLHRAMVYAGSTYTTVGFISDPLPIQWQLLSVIMAVSGLFSFGWSTAMVFMISQALFPSER